MSRSRLFLACAYIKINLIFSRHSYINREAGSSLHARILLSVCLASISKWIREADSFFQLTTLLSYEVSSSPLVVTPPIVWHLSARDAYLFRDPQRSARFSSWFMHYVFYPRTVKVHEYKSSISWLWDFTPRTYPLYCTSYTCAFFSMIRVHDFHFQAAHSTFPW